MGKNKDISTIQDIFTNNRLGWNTNLPYPKNRYPLGMNSTELLIYSPDLYTMYRTEGDDRDNFPDYDEVVQYGFLASEMAMPDWYPFLGDLDPNPYGVFPKNRIKGKKLNLQDVKAKESGYNGQPFMAMDFSPETRKVMMSGVGNFENVFTELNFTEAQSVSALTESSSIPRTSSVPRVIPKVDLSSALATPTMSIPRTSSLGSSTTSSPRGATLSTSSTSSTTSSGCGSGTSTGISSGDSSRCYVKPTVQEMGLINLAPIDNQISQIVSSTTTLAECTQKCQQAFPVNSSNWIANRKKCVEKCYSTKPVVSNPSTGIATSVVDSSTTSSTTSSAQEQVIQGGALPSMGGGMPMGGGGGSASSEQGGGAEGSQENSSGIKKATTTEIVEERNYKPMLFLLLIGAIVGYYVARKYGKNTRNYSVVGALTGAVIGYVYSNGLPFGNDDNKVQGATDKKESSFCGPCMAALV